MQNITSNSAIIFFGANGTQGQSYVALLDASSLDILWEEEAPRLLNGVTMKEGSANPIDGAWWQPAVTFATDKAALYIVHADQEKLTMVDFSTHSITTQELSKPLTWIEQLLMLTTQRAYAKMGNGVLKQATISPDGSQLYVIGSNFSMEEGAEERQQGLGLQRIDPKSGAINAEYDTEAHA